jgi:hypothetical protein
MNNPKIQAPDDWRRQGQEKYLIGVKLLLTDYYPPSDKWDHDHCEFCGKKFSLNNDVLKKADTSEHHYRWICEESFNDFKEEFKWKVSS